jgi:hypothetical protein
MGITYWFEMIGEENNLVAQWRRSLAGSRQSGPRNRKNNIEAAHDNGRPAPALHYGHSQMICQVPCKCNPGGALAMSATAPGGPASAPFETDGAWNIGRFLI